MIDRPQKSSPIGRNPAARAASSPTTAALESRATGAPKVDSKSTSIPRAGTSQRFSVRKEARLRRPPESARDGRLSTGFHATRPLSDQLELTHGADRKRVRDGADTSVVRRASSTQVRA